MPNEPARQSTLRTVLITLGVVSLGLIGLYLLRSFAATLLLIFAGVLLGAFLLACAALVQKWLRLPAPLAPVWLSFCSREAWRFSSGSPARRRRSRCRC